MSESSTPSPNASAAASVPRGEAPRVIVIRPQKGWVGIDFGELWHYRELLFFLIWRDVKVRYKQTVLGAAWAILVPVLTMIVFTIIFGRFVGLSARIQMPYPLFLYAALVPWTFFAAAVSQSGVCLVNQASLLTKIYFPRLFIPAASVGTAVVDFALSFAVYVCMMIGYWRAPGASIALLPVLVLLTVAAALGTGFLLASVTVVYRDIRYVVPFLMQIWMYGCPVVYSVGMVPERWRWVMSLNPMFGIIAAFRGALLNEPVNWPELGISSSVAVGIFLVGLFNFRRMERRFADIA